MTNSRQPKIVYILSVLMLLALIFVGYTSYRVITLQPGEQQVTPAGTIAKPSNNVKDAIITDDGKLLLTYEDGTQRTVGDVSGVQGLQGEAGPGPSQAEIAIAVANYCGGGRCDAKAPTADQVATAVYNYCSSRNDCKGATGDAGATGADGANATNEQIMAAVQQYCSSGRCTGPQGAQGVAGADGKSTVMSCVIRETNSLPTQYVAWKYETEPNSAYRDLYKLPAWAQGSDCVDLRG